MIGQVMRSFHLHLSAFGITPFDLDLGLLTTLHTLRFCFLCYTLYPIGFYIYEEVMLLG